MMIFSSARQSVLALFINFSCISFSLALNISRPSFPYHPRYLNKTTAPTVLAMDTPSFNTYTPPASYTGDVLNMTKCYCEDLTAVNQFSPQTYSGFYYKFDYFNHHNRQLYTLVKTCYSNVKFKQKFWLPLCWDTSRAVKVRKDFPDGNIFAYKQGSDGDWGDGQNEHIFFNNQKRGLPKPGPGTIEYDPSVCVGYCKEYVHGMTAMSTRQVPGLGSWDWHWHSWDHRVTTFKNRFTSFTKVDDMCDHCA